MSVRRLRVSSLVKQPPEIDVSVGMPRIDRQRAPVRLGRLLGSGGLQLAAPPVPFLGRERPALFFLRLGKRAARDRTGAAGKIRDPEIEEDLPRLRLPASRPVDEDDALPFDRDADAPEPASSRELLAQVLESLAHAARGDARREQAARGLQRDEILKRKTEFPAAASPGLKESRTNRSADLARRQFQDPRDIGGAVGLHDRKRKPGTEDRSPASICATPPSFRPPRGRRVWRACAPPRPTRTCARRAPVCRDSGGAPPSGR